MAIRLLLSITLLLSLAAGAMGDSKNAGGHVKTPLGVETKFLCRLNHSEGLVEIFTLVSRI